MVRFGIMYPKLERVLNLSRLIWDIVKFGILEVPNLIESQTYLKYGWVWGCMSQT